jgi:hypothetical protein
MDHNWSVIVLSTPVMVLPESMDPDPDQWARINEPGINGRAQITSTQITSTALLPYPRRFHGGTSG